MGYKQHLYEKKSGLRIGHHHERVAGRTCEQLSRKAGRGGKRDSLGFLRFGRNIADITPNRFGGEGKEY